MGTGEKKVSLALPDGRILEISTGKFAGQAHGSAVVKLGGTVVFAAAVSSDRPSSNVGFMPLTVDYRERASAAGKIPGGFFKREGKPTEKEILSARLIDRSIRPLFPKGYSYETFVYVFVFSSDQENPADILGIIAASAALSVSDIPFGKTIAGVGVGLLDDNFILLPTLPQLEKSSLDLVVAGHEDGIVMVESGSKEIPEDKLVSALSFAHEWIRRIVERINWLSEIAGKPKREWTPVLPPEEVVSAIKASFWERIAAIDQKEGKKKMNIALKEVKQEIEQFLMEKFPDGAGDYSAEQLISFLDSILEDIHREAIRGKVLNEGIRADGRGPRDIRPISIEVGLLPRTHGSALFTRGETQALVTATLGTFQDVQFIDDIEEEGFKRFMLHYNFPPFSVGEPRPLRAPSRREVGHGALAERALLPLIPPEEQFPYTIRVVSDILSSNGSSSMATVCGGSLALMDAGVPIREHVAGVAMGLIMEGDKYVVLTDILGLEDHLGDMDFKVAGTTKGVTALQMDVKVPALDLEILREALEQARQARMEIIEKMNQAIPEPRKELSPYAPRMLYMEIPPEKVPELIGPGGKVVKGIIEKAGVKISIEQDGGVRVVAPSDEALDEAKRMIMTAIKDVKEGDVYEGKVTRLFPFGVLVEFLPGREGLLHISQITDRRIKDLASLLKVGDTIKVRILSVAADGKITLSHKEFSEEESSPVKQRLGSASQEEPRRLQQFHSKGQRYAQGHRGHRNLHGSHGGPGRAGHRDNSDSSGGRK